MAEDVRGSRGSVQSYRLDEDRLDGFLKAACKGRSVFALGRPAEGQDQYHLVRAVEWRPEEHCLGPYRPVEPLKALVFPPRERVGGDVADRDDRERIVVGVKNCDLSALQIHDHVFLQSEPVDPFYAEARRNTIVISCDCTEPRETCFCPVVKEQPYAKGGFDVNLSMTSTGVVVETGTDRGRALVREAVGDLEPAEEAMLAERENNRQAMTRRVCEQAERKGLECGRDLQKAVQATAESQLWKDFARDCVECGACNLACCTCHCFVMVDGKTGDRAARVKQWDSCLYMNFARVAGGANPRKHRAERLYNRFEKKFSFFPEVLGIYACDGCGRCAQACTGKIDIRDVLKRAVDESR